LALKPVSSPPPVSEKTEKSEFGSPNQSPVGDPDLEDAPDSNRHSMHSHSATETNP